MLHTLRFSLQSAVYFIMLSFWFLYYSHFTYSVCWYLNVKLQCQKVKEQRNILHEIRKRKANWTGHILRRNCLIQRVTEGRIQGGIEVTGRQGRRRSNLLDYLKERRGYSHLKEEALDRTVWRARFGRGFGPVVRQTTKWNDLSLFQIFIGKTLEADGQYSGTGYLWARSILRTKPNSNSVVESRIRNTLRWAH